MPEFISIGYPADDDISLSRIRLVRTYEVTNHILLKKEDVPREIRYAAQEFFRVGQYRQDDRLLRRGKV